MKRLRFKIRTIRGHIALYSCIIFTIIILLFGSLSYNYISNTMSKEILSYTQKIIEEKKSNIDSLFSQVVTLMQQTASNAVLNEATQPVSPTDFAGLLNNQRRIDDYLQNVQKFNPIIKDFIVLDKNGIAIDQTGAAVRPEYRFKDQSWYSNQLFPYFRVNFIGVHSQDYYASSNSDEMIVSAIAPIYDFFRPLDSSFPMLLCNLSVSKIQSLAKETQLEKSGFLIVIDAKGEPIFKPSTNIHWDGLSAALQKQVDTHSGNFILNESGVRFVVVYDTSKVTGWKIVSLIPLKEISAHTYRIGTYFLMATGICIILVLIASFIISAKLTRPIVRLIQKMQQIERGDNHLKLYDTSTEEIEKLTYRIDSLIENIKILTGDVYTYQIQSKVMELRALQSQINPHFLYNTLQSIKALSVTGRNKDISTMVTLIGGMLRYAINNVQDIVTVSSELQHIEMYMQIQNYRYPDQFRYDIDCDDSLKSISMIKLSLQPIVENAILHGFHNRGQGSIRILVQKAKDLTISVYDDGNGMSAADSDRLRSKLSGKPGTETEGGVGLMNVHHRIQMKYGEAYGLQIATNVEQGTCIQIVIPWEEFL
ncbi:sensor histidine kinase [Paenibacillus sp. FSL H8-0034]|uniref:sensor histidine kinase n=1 Tax=Paenibacillus sp. FSL H8-0034 TaxID=2954671 RepID=UPI0030FB4A6A